MMRNFIIIYFLLNSIFCFNIDQYYRKQFKNGTSDPHLKLSNKSSENIVPLLKYSQNIPKNATLLKIDKNQTIISCSKFPYQELLSQYINQFLQKKRETSSFYLEEFILIVKILYYKYAPLKEIKNEFKSMNLSITDEFEYELSNYLKEYIDAIYSQLNSEKYSFKYNINNNDFIKRYNLENNFIPYEVYDYMMESIEQNKNKKVMNYIKSFLSNKKDEFLKLFYYINENGNTLSYPQYQEIYLGIRNKTNYMKSTYICLYISPITDMLDIKVNTKSRVVSLNPYPIFNNSILLYTNNPMRVSDNNGTLTKFFTVSNENIFFQYHYLFKDFKKYNPKKYLYLKSIDIIFPKKLIDGPESKKITTCHFLNICRGLITNDENTYKMTEFIGDSTENPLLVNFGRLLFLDEELLNENNKEKFQLFLRSFAKGTKINEENEILAYLFYYQQLNREISHYKDFFNDIINKEKEIEENKDLFRLIEMNLDIVLKNYKFILDKLENMLTKQIMDI